MAIQPPFSKSADRRCAALTVMELLVTIVIVGILVSFLLGGFGVMRRAAQRAASTNDLRSSALGVLNMINDENRMLKVWKGGTSGSSGAWAMKLYLKGYIKGTDIFYATPRQPGIERPTANWYLYTWGINLADPRAAQSINTAPDGYQLSVTRVDNPGTAMLLADSVLINTITSHGAIPRQTFRLLNSQGTDSGTSSGIYSRDGRTVNMAFFDGHVEYVELGRLRSLGFRRVILESGQIMALPAH